MDAFIQPLTKWSTHLLFNRDADTENHLTSFHLADTLIVGFIVLPRFIKLRGSCSHLIPHLKIQDLLLGSIAACLCRLQSHYQD